MARIRTRYALEQAASPPAPEHGRSARGTPRGSDRAPGSRQPRAVAALALPLWGALPERWVWPVDSPLERAKALPLRGAMAGRAWGGPRHPLFASEILASNSGQNRPLFQAKISDANSGEALFAI
jgi:hypothetical protein